MSTHINRLRCAISNTPGTTGALTVSTADAGFRGFGAAQDGQSFDCIMTDGSAWEVRTSCVYTHSGTSLSRGTLEDSSTGSAISLTSATKVAVTMSASMGNHIETQFLGDIAGLEMVWVSSTAVTINTGSAQIESSGNLVRVSTPIAVTGLTLSANSWYHVYLYESSGSPAIEVSSTAPATPYFATARSKTGDTSKRYVGSLRAVTGGAIDKFMHDVQSGLVVYRLAALATTYRVLSNGTATTSTTVSISSLMPTTSTLVLVKVSNTDSGNAWFIAAGDDVANAATSSGYYGIANGIRSTFPMPTNTSQEVTYDWNATPTGGAYIDVLGYWYKR